MKLKNKKTGEIIEAESCNNTGGCISIYYEEKDGQIGTKDCYTSLAELNEEWEDVPEKLKEHWCVTMYGGITHIKDEEEPIDDLTEIGNYFDSKEDAYDALYKLKAWQRLKYKGFRFKHWTYKMDEPKIENHTHFMIVGVCEDGVRFNDLDLLFSQEDD